MVVRTHGTHTNPRQTPTQFVFLLGSLYLEECNTTILIFTYVEKTFR